MANCFVRCCRKVKHLPTGLLLFLVFVIQAATLNYYLSHYKGMAWLAMLSYLLDEDMFFGPNTLKTALALAGVLFLLLLSSLHDAKPGTERKRYIEELTGTVIFDILDGVDSMEILFIKEDRDDFPPGLEDTIIAIACINFILPTIPLLTLNRTKYGLAKMSQKLVMIHKICLAFAVNLPLLITRMILWHGLNHGVSIFSLKNIIVMAMISYDFYEHHEVEEEREERGNKGEGNGKENGKTNEDVPDMYVMEDRFNYSST
ncbi:hypothetical protein FSP39_004031 [Pinctada imbricata]|uniref:Uncharacterized protein n=1 Tax=Pinctada imbricata TaxID=66713 RepID=A0AA88XPQ2_PINIB|nr:hypothetical protein FSP39_004031 [Pinctada imbricata]